MASRWMVRRLKSPQRPIYRPQLIRLEERLPLGDALVGLLLAASWLGAHEQEATEGTESFQKENVFGWSLRTQNWNSLWGGVAGRSGEAVADGEILVASAPRPGRPAWSGLEEGVDNGTFQAMGRGTADLSERPILFGDAPNGAPGMEITSLTPYLGRSGRAENVGLLQALASVRLAGHGGQGRETVPQRGAVPKEQVQANYAQRSLSFEANVGQADASVQFLAHGPGYGLYLTGTEAVMVLSQRSEVRDQGSGIGRATAIPTRSVSEEPASLTANPQALTPASVVRMQVLGGNANPRVMGEDPLPGKVNYFLGNDPSQWHSNISTFGKVEYQQVYPGIDLVYYGSGQQLEYDFVVAPGADPSVIRLGFTGADSLAVDQQGNLVVHAGGQDIIQHKPMVYQQVDGARQKIASQFMLLDPSTSLLATRHSPPATPQVAFQLAPYDTSRPLVIDPVLSYSTYLGGSGGEGGAGIAVDPTTGDALVTGYTVSTDFPTANPLQPNLGGNENAFVARLSADGSALLFATYLGGSGYDFGVGIAVDPSTGDVLITGGTSSTNFPTANPFQPNLAGFGNAFVARLSADGSALVFSTYLGGRYNDIGTGIAVDPTTSDVLVTGGTRSTNFPTANPLQPNLGGSENAFVARLSADGSALVFSTYLGGGYIDNGYGIAVDPATGDVLVTGSTASTNFPVANPLQRFNRGGYDAFVARLRGDGSALVFSTYLGGGGDDSGVGIAVDQATGDILITGGTRSTNFPTVNPLQANNQGFNNAFVARLRADGSTLVYSTYLGGSYSDSGFGIAVDPTTGDALVTGHTNSYNFPTVNPLQPNYGGGGADAFVARLNVDGSALVFSTYLGGSNDDGGTGIAVDLTTGDILVTGGTNSPNFPTTPGAFQTTCGTDGNCNYDGDYYYSNVFVSRIA